LKSIITFALLLGACLTLPGSALAQNEKAVYPAPIRALKADGISIRASMPAPAGFQGFIGEYRGQPMPVYLLPDGKHVMVGSLFDVNGKDLTSESFASHARTGMNKNIWAQLGKATWIAEGSPEAERIVYVFTDTECPYCHRLWHAIRSQVEKGQVQVRYLLVAVIKRQSLPRAVTVLDAPDPLAALTRNERDFRDSPIKLASSIPATTRAKIGANIALMNQLGIHGTPGIVYKDAQGHVQKIIGMPPEAAIRTVFGP
jgi:thiol:disulfide interchange protein DsbG